MAKFMSKKKEEKKEEKEDNWLKELCGNDEKLYDLLSQSIYLDPIKAISKTDLKVLVEEAEKNIKEENYEKAMLNYRMAVDKAIFEATQNSGEIGRHIKVIQDLTSKTAKVTEEAKEKGEKEGFASPSLKGRIKYYESICERAEDVVRIASLVYNERLEELGADGRRELRRKERREAGTKEEMEDRKERERREARKEERKEMGKEERREAEIKDKGEEKKERERREARDERGEEAEREEKRTGEEEKGRRNARRKEVR